MDLNCLNGCSLLVYSFFPIIFISIHFSSYFHGHISSCLVLMYGNLSLVIPRKRALPCCVFSLQISPLRPQRPKSQVINLMGEKRLSVSPGAPANPSAPSVPPPITPRAKLQFSLLSGSSMSYFTLICQIPLQFYFRT